MSDKDIQMPDIIKEINEEYKKMSVLRAVAKKFPTGQIHYILKALDEAWEETKEMQRLQPPKKKNKK